MLSIRRARLAGVVYDGDELLNGVEADFAKIPPPSQGFVKLETPHSAGPCLRLHQQADGDGRATGIESIAVASIGLGGQQPNGRPSAPGGSLCR